MALSESRLDRGGSAALALDNIRVIDFSRLLPGPWCSQMLGDLGADVIKIEQPGTGDYSRYNPPNYKTSGVYFSSVNRNKRSVALDLTLPQDRADAYRLIACADVVVESYRPGVTQRLGLGYDSLRALNPSIIYCSVTGFRSDGALAKLPGHDLSIQGMAGAMAKNLAAGEVPANPRFQGGDFAAAAFSAIGVLGAIIRRMRTGQGAFLEVPLYDSVMSWSAVALSGALARQAGLAGTPEIEVWGSNPRYAVYRTRDGKAVTVSLLEGRTWNAFCRLIGRDDLATNEDLAARVSNHGEQAALYRSVLGQLCAAHDRDHLTSWMMREGIPICPIYDPDEALAAMKAGGRDVIGTVHSATDGPIPVVLDPLARAGLADPLRRAPPALGEHTLEIRNSLCENDVA